MKGGLDIMTLKNDNRGLSLIELIVTVLITSILMLAVSLFVSTSRSAYQTVNTSATLQEESLTVERVVSEVLMEAQNFGMVPDPNEVTPTLPVYGPDDHASKVLWVRALDNESTSGDYSVYFFVYDTVDKQLRYCKGTETTLSDTLDEVSLEGDQLIENNCFGTNQKYSLVADHIEDFSLKSVVSRPNNTGDLVTIECKLSYAGKEYDSNIAAVTRNKLRDSVVTPSPDPTGTEDPD